MTPAVNKKIEKKRKTFQEREQQKKKTALQNKVAAANARATEQGSSSKRENNRTRQQQRMREQPELQHMIQDIAGDNPYQAVRSPWNESLWDDAGTSEPESENEEMEVA